MNDLFLHILMQYYAWRCRKCRKGDHAWEEMDSQRSADLWEAMGEEYIEWCKRPSCTAMR